MFCTKCGKQLDNSAKFCSACGNPVSAEAPEAVSPLGTPVITKPEEPQAPESPVIAEFEDPQASESPVIAEPEEPQTPESPVIAESEKPQAPESPIIAESEEPKAPESPVTAEPAPTESSPAQSAPVEAVTPSAPTFEEFARESPAPKKKKKIAPWIAGGTAVVLVGTAAIGYFGFYNQVMRLFMGDAGFALHVEKKTGELLSFDERASEKLNETLAAQIDEMFLLKKERDADDFDFEDYEQAQMSAMISELLTLAERFGGSELTYGMSMELDELLSGLLLTRSEEEFEGLNLLGNFQNILRVTHTEAADQFEFTSKYGGKEFLSGALTIDPQKFAVTFPELSSYTFFSEYAAAADGEPSLACSAEEIERICGAVAELYYEAYAEAEITYEDGSFTVAGQTVECTKIRASLSAEQTNALYRKVNDLLKNDEYLRDYYRSATGEDMSGYNALFDDLDAFSVPLISESYIGRNAKLLAKTYSIEKNVKQPKENTDDEPFTFEYANPDETDHFRIGMPDGTRIGVDTSKNAETEEDDGTIEFSYKNSSEENAPTLVLALDYINDGTTEYLGEPINLGTYTIRISEKDTLIRSLLRGNSAIDEDMMSVNESEQSGAAILSGLFEKFALTVAVKPIEGEESAIRTDLTLSFGEYLSLSAYLEQRPLADADRPIVMPATDGEKCVNIAEEPDTETLRLIQIDLYEKLLALPDGNESLEKLFDSLGLSEGIEEELNQLREELEFEKHYRKYSSYTRSDAIRAARSLSDELEAQGLIALTWNTLLSLNEDASDYNDTWGREEFERTVKLYFDENGKVTVLDDGKMGFLDYSELSQTGDRENLYVELLFSYFSENPLCGITAVYTDDPNDLPENLPTVYHYLDGVYEWNGKENAIGGFAVGTFPSLSEGKSTAEDRIRAEIEELHARDEKISELNNAAKRLSSALTGFLSANPSFFRSDVLLASVIVKYDENGGWIVESHTGNDLEAESQTALFTSGVSAVSQLTDHLNRRFPDFDPVTAQIHFVRGDGNNSGMSGGGNAPTDPGRMSVAGTAVIENGTGLFQDGNLPDALDFWTGYCNWTENNPHAVPRIGIYWTDWGEYTLVGTYCKETDAPLADWDEALNGSGNSNYDDPLLAEADALNRDAQLLCDTITGLFGGTAIGEYDEDDDPPLFSLVLSGRNNEWLMTGAYMNNYRYEDSGELIDDDTFMKLMEYLNGLAGSGDLPMSRDVKVELHFLHNELVGAAVVPIESNLDFPGYGTPSTWDFHDGVFYNWNAGNRNEAPLSGIYWIDANTAVPFGSYCVNTGAPLRLTE